MTNPKKMLSAIAVSLCMLALILDSKTAIAGGTDGIALCISTVIPALFPFFILSCYFVSNIDSIPILRPITKLLRMPGGSESYLAVGLLGGYPVGAKSIAQGYKAGAFDKENAERMLSFCSNAGPSFIFGMGYIIFQNLWICTIIWLIHIFSALIVGFLSPNGFCQPAVAPRRNPNSLPAAMKSAIISMATVCGWVVALRVVIAFAQRWVLWLLPQTWQILLIGLLELTNGVTFLRELDSLSLQFLLFSLFLSFGGLCVWLQTTSVLSDSGLSGKQYLPGKVTQAALSFLLSIPALPFLEKSAWRVPMAAVLFAFTIPIYHYLKSRKFQNSGSFFHKSHV